MTGQYPREIYHIGQQKVVTKNEMVRVLLKFHWSKKFVVGVAMMSPKFSPVVSQIQMRCLELCVLIASQEGALAARPLRPLL